MHERPEHELDDPHRVTGVEPEIAQGYWAKDAKVHAVESMVIDRHLITIS